MLIRAAMIGVVLGLGIAPNHAVAQSDRKPSFQFAPCDLPDATPEFVSRLTCGTVAVPRDRGTPDAGIFDLAVVIVKAEGGHKQADPVVYVAGGPGSPLTARATLIAQHEAGVIAPNRDLILVDQRGSGRSEPTLCPGLARRQLAIFAAGSEQAALVRAWRESYGLCRREMATAGLKPEWFGTQVTGADYETVRQALGIDRWNVYALSYGTTVAMTMMAQHPDRLRAVILDSVFPPDPLPMSLPQTFGHALDLLFAACQVDDACASAHPRLAVAFDEAVRTLDAEPLRVSIRTGLGMDGFSLRAEAFRLIVNRALYSRQTMAILPSFIDAARNRRPAAMQELIGATARGFLAMSAGVMAAVECRDRASWQEAVPSDEGDPPVSAFVAGMCKEWSPLGPPPLIASDTPVATLLLAGTIDPITPPAFARAAAAAMGAKARVVEFANVGHGALQSSGCGEALVTAFFRDPSNAIDEVCAPQIAPVRFR